MSFLGKTYVLDSQNNFDGFINSLGQALPEAAKQALINHKSTVKLTQNGDSYTLETSSPSGLKENVFKSGVEFLEDVQGNTGKITLTLEGNTLHQVSKFNHGTMTNKRVFSGDTMVSTITTDSWDGVATRNYKAA